MNAPSQDALLLIFVKNRIEGNVKTRLAKDIGHQNALKIYDILLKHTREVTQDLSCDCHVYYSDFVPEFDEWDTKRYGKKVQTQADLGTRMSHAFREGFAAGYQRLAIIGSDCYELRPSHLKEAFESLHHHDFAVGAAADGGYYLLGMKTYRPSVFENIVWSTDTVLAETMKRIEKLNATCHMLPMLNDVDTVDDLGDLRRYLIDETGES